MHTAISGQFPRKPQRWKHELLMQKFEEVKQKSPVFNRYE